MSAQSVQNGRDQVERDESKAWNEREVNNQLPGKYQYAKPWNNLSEKASGHSCMQWSESFHLACERHS